MGGRRLRWRLSLIRVCVILGTLGRITIGFFFFFFFFFFAVHLSSFPRCITRIPAQKHEKLREILTTIQTCVTHNAVQSGKISGGAWQEEEGGEADFFFSPKKGTTEIGITPVGVYPLEGLSEQLQETQRRNILAAQGEDELALEKSFSEEGGGGTGRGSTVMRASSPCSFSLSSSSSSPASPSSYLCTNSLPNTSTGSSANTSSVSSSPSSPNLSSSSSGASVLSLSSSGGGQLGSLSFNAPPGTLSLSPRQSSFAAPAQRPPSPPPPSPPPSPPHSPPPSLIDGDEEGEDDGWESGEIYEGNLDDDEEEEEKGEEEKGGGGEGEREGEGEGEEEREGEGGKGKRKSIYFYKATGSTPVPPPSAKPSLRLFFSCFS